MKDQDQLPPGEPYKGPSSIARKSPWLTNEDIPHDKDTVVTIEEIVLRRNVAFEEGRKEPVVLSARFKGKKRELALNATNRETLAAITGSKNCEKWFGLTIALYVKPDVRLGRDTVCGVRIRNKRIDPARAQPDLSDANYFGATPPTSEHEREIDPDIVAAAKIHAERKARGEQP